jgi:hypothetical protein
MDSSKMNTMVTIGALGLLGVIAYTMLTKKKSSCTCLTCVTPTASKTTTAGSCINADMGGCGFGSSESGWCCNTSLSGLGFTALGSLGWTGRRFSRSTVPYP